MEPSVTSIFANSLPAICSEFTTRSVAFIDPLALGRCRADAPGRSATEGVRWAMALRNHCFEQDRPADQGVAAIADTGLDGQVQVVGFVN
jgi:hypothetical protein